MIKKYAKEKNVMLLLTTHRLDLAKDLATKRYHINQNGVLEQMPVKNVVNIKDLNENDSRVTAEERKEGLGQIKQMYGATEKSVDNSSQEINKDDSNDKLENL